MHSEFYQLDEKAAEIINETKKRGGRVVCVGTTSCRTVESAAAKLKEEDAGGRHLVKLKEKDAVLGQPQSLQRAQWVKACSGWTDIFIYPGYKFQVLDALVTNFHLPESTLVMLVSALAGREHVLNAYETAVKEQYRFFSFGDAMLIV